MLAMPDCVWLRHPVFDPVGVDVCLAQENGRWIMVVILREKSCRVWAGVGLYDAWALCRDWVRRSGQPHKHDFSQEHNADFGVKARSVQHE